MFYNLPQFQQSNLSQWKTSNLSIAGTNTNTGEVLSIPIQDDNMLIVGITGTGKSILTKKIVEAHLTTSEEPFVIFLDIKNDFREYIRANDKSVTPSSSNTEPLNHFKWNLIREIRQSDDWNSSLDAFLDAFFIELSSDPKNLLWVSLAKNLFKAYINVYLYCTDLNPSNATLIHRIKTMRLKELVTHLKYYEPNRSILRDILNYDDSIPIENLEKTKLFSDVMAFLNIVLEKFNGNFCSTDGTDTIHDFLDGHYGRRLFLLYDYSKRASCSLFFRLILQRIIEAKLSQKVNRSQKVLLVLDEASMLDFDFGLMKGATLGRANNLQIILCMQSLHQLYCIAPQVNSEHITNSSFAGFPSTFVFRSGEPFSIELLQKIYGNKNKQILQMPLNRYAQPQIQYITEPLVTSEDFSSLKTGECFIKIGNAIPVKTKITL